MFSYQTEKCLVFLPIYNHVKLKISRLRHQENRLLVGKFIYKKTVNTMGLTIS